MLATNVIELGVREAKVSSLGRARRDLAARARRRCRGPGGCRWYRRRVPGTRPGTGSRCCPGPAATCATRPRGDRQVAADLGVPWEERDITQSEADLRAYGDKIPVTLIDGVQHDFWQVSEQRLRTALAAAGAGSHGGRG